MVVVHSYIYIRLPGGMANELRFSSVIIGDPRPSKSIAVSHDMDPALRWAHENKHCMVWATGAVKGPAGFATFLLFHCPSVESLARQLEVLPVS